jgi:RHS repeat-associated protein
VLDGFGQIVSQTDARGVVVAHTYDGLGRRLTRSVNGKRIAQWGYDAVKLGVLDYERGGSEGLAAYCRGYDYDAFGRVLEQITFAEAQILSVQNAWDGRYGRLKGTRFPSARDVAFDFTANGYPLAERDPKSTLVYRRITAMSADGKVAGEQFGNGLTGAYSYDPSSGQPTELWVRPPGLIAPPVQHLSYAYNDPLGRLSGHGSTISVGAGTVNEGFSYDAVSRLIRSNRSWGFGTLPPQVVDYQYDALGNLTVKSDYSTLTRYGTPTRNNPANAGPHAIQSAQLVGGALVSDFLYDANGNLLRGDGRVAIYDAFDKPTQVTEAGKTVRFAYGPNGELYRRTTASDRTYHVDQLHERVVPFGSSAVVERSYVAGKTILNRDATGAQANRYLHLDRLASVDTVTDDQGAVIRRQGFDPFGGPRSGAWLAVSTLSNPATDRGFTGHEQVDDVHAIHMGGRLYDHRLGRFMSVDPFVVDPTDAQSLNAYSYARNNPIGRIDPSGYKDLAPYEPGTHFLDDLTKSLNKFGDDVRDKVKSVTKTATKALGDLHKGSASPTPGNPPKGTREHDRGDAPEDTLGATKTNSGFVAVDLDDTVTVGPMTVSRTVVSLAAFGFHFRIVELDSGGHDVELTRDFSLGPVKGEAGGSVRVDSESTKNHRIGDASVVERTKIPVAGTSVPLTDTKHPVGSLGFGFGTSRALDKRQELLDQAAGIPKQESSFQQCAQGCPD